MLPRIHWQFLLLSFFLALQAIASERVGVYTGTFDPMHFGHLYTISAAAEAGKLEKIFVIPNIEPENKPDAKELKTRWELVKAATQDDPRIVVPDLEILEKFQKEKRSTREVLEWLKGSNPADTEFFHLMGTDSLEKLLAKVQKPDLTFSNIIVGERGKGTERLVRAAERKGLRVIATVPLITTSSTNYRLDPLAFENALPEAEARLIKERGLYGRGSERGFYDLPAQVHQQIDREQLLNERSNDSRYYVPLDESKVPPEYKATARRSFHLYRTYLPLEEAVVLATDPAELEKMVVEKNGRKMVPLIVHPQAKDFFDQALPNAVWDQELLATPTSSYRSLVAWDPKSTLDPLDLKLSFNVEVGGSVRLLTRKQIERAVATSAAFHQIPKEDLARRGIAFFDEPVSVMPKGFNYGYTLRTRGNIPKDVDIVPYHSLYAKPRKGDPMLIKMIEESGEGPRAFLEKNIIGPMIDNGVFFGMEHGLVGEFHEQNVAAAVKNGKLTGLNLYRDLAGFALNPQLRRAAGRDMNFIPEGVGADALKLERGELIDMLENYLRKSNFYAMRVMVEKYRPEWRNLITEEWIEKASLQRMAKALKPYIPYAELRPNALALEGAVDYHAQTRGGKNRGFLGLPAQSAGSPVEKGGFIAPNERFPERALPLWEKSRDGAYVAVGTERGFLGAANSNATHLLLVDHDPDAVKFNQINTELLRVAKNRQDYLRLRTKPDLNEWMIRLSHAPEAKEWSAWWKARVSDAKGFEALHTGQAPRHPDFDAVPFEKVNYLHDDAQFKKLQEMARAGKIEARLLDLNQEAKVAQVVEALKKAGIPLSVLDISNAWSPSYLKPVKLKALVEKFGETATNKSMLMMTMDGDVLDAKMDFRYFAYQFDRLKTEEGRNLIFDNLLKRPLNWDPKIGGDNTPAQNLNPNPRITRDCQRAFRDLGYSIEP